MKTQSFQLSLDGIAYEIKATPYHVNEETRFRVSYNGSPVHIFAWDNDENRLAVIGKESDMIPGKLATAIADKLQAA